MVSQPHLTAASRPPAAPPQVLPAADQVRRAGAPEIQRVRRRRRPSGEPPPLPRHLAASGKLWLALSGVLVLAWVGVSVTGSLGLVELVDTRLLQAIAEVRSPGLTRVAEVAPWPPRAPSTCCG